ncbi:Phosphoglycerate kinase [[Mycoplasma] cavipharyngis]|uniref:phosphoglycerate kinase n=1 Tax=[Mycoplasma] cavipharyngis TaxID=92757 RepID=UPI00370444FC
MKYHKKQITDLDLANQVVLVRLDLNVPMKQGQVVDHTRIVQSLPTLQYLIKNNCKIIVLSHLSRIKSLKDKTGGEKSLAPVAKVLDQMLDTPVLFCSENTGDRVIQAVKQLKPKEILVLENTRYQDVNDQGEIVKLESKNDSKLAQFWASLATVFINDAFGTAHRSHASNVGIATYLKNSAIGFLIDQELVNLAKACDQYTKPLIAVLGGSKISDKLKVINQIAKKADKVLIGGGMAYTFKKAQGYDVGDSLIEESMIESCHQMLEQWKDKLVLPTDAVVNAEFADLPGRIVKYQKDVNLWNNDIGLDIGPETIANFCAILDSAKTVVWNGPVGVFEFSNYQTGTRAIANKMQEITKNNAFTLIGGGDSASAYQQFNQGQGVSFISTGGGASLAYMEGQDLLGISVIANK